MEQHQALVGQDGVGARIQFLRPVNLAQANAYQPGAEKAFANQRCVTGSRGLNSIAR